MNDPKTMSSNEVETLVFKAARGGGLPLGYAEDLATATQYLDLESLTRCPCSGARPDAIAIQTALDFVMAGDAPQTVGADAGLIQAYVAAAQRCWQKRLIWNATATGAVFEKFEDSSPDMSMKQGRRSVQPDLAKHLSEMAAKLLVPETDASRAAGAGAGLTDND
ncbi:DUF3726 domain-containing protein [Octadecabacter sp. G9-8]|uniref:DUF3726 domain-containing protein n=1 Tax=Octadecabacter dasysiphoniae TaxID=2909341 RepID=A0ABS9D1W5_9RHOB|nr:DUF3726 domain-containing protein [Octadecabacter dasysiphoniae]MCF2872401.1 DUF3726 domain-containing protein [Octadecabacter dasysiphoniae]